MATDRYTSDRQGSRDAQRTALFPLATITLLGEQRDIIDPGAAVPVAGMAYQALVLESRRRRRIGIGSD